MKVANNFGVFGHLDGYACIDLTRLPDQSAIARLPVWRKILLEGLLRNLGRSDLPPARTHLPKTVL